MGHWLLESSSETGMTHQRAGDLEGSHAGRENPVVHHTPFLGLSDCCCARPGGPATVRPTMDVVAEVDFLESLSMSEETVAVSSRRRWSGLMTTASFPEIHLSLWTVSVTSSKGAPHQIHKETGTMDRLWILMSLD